MALGIAFDIGAYACKAALIRGENESPSSLLYNNVLRSVVYVDKNNKIFVGEKAAIHADRDPERGFFDVKRRILKGAQTLPGIPGVTYIDLYIALVKEVLARCQKNLRGTDVIDHVILTVPSFLEEHNDIISEMKRAAESIEYEKGKNLKADLLIEPAGVAIYNLDEEDKSAESAEKERIRAQIVYDLGHSTLDVALVSSKDTKGYAYELHSFQTDDETFGEYFDMRIAEEIQKSIAADYPKLSRRQQARIMAAAVEMKHALSERDEWTVMIDLTSDEVEFTMSRERFEELIINRLQESSTLVADAIEVAEEKGLKVDEIILAGGGSSIPLVKKCIEAVAGDIPVKRSLRPVDAVSYGAAIYGLAHNLQQRSKFAYGVQMPVKTGSLNRIVELIAPADSVLPYKSDILKDEKFVCNEDGVFRTILYAGNSKSAGERLPADDCMQIRHMAFDIAPNQSLGLCIEIDEEHCVKVVCQTENNDRYVMTSFDPANAVSRKEN